LAGTQPGARVGDGVFGIEPLLGGVEQVHAPGVGVALLHALQEVAVRRGRINAGEDRLIALEDLVVQAHANARQILRAVDRPGALRGLLDPGVNRPDAQRQAEQVAQQLHHVAIRAVHDQDDGQCEAAHPGFAHARERLGQRRYGRHGERHIHRLARALPLRSHELAARAVPACQARHRFRSRQGRDAHSLAGGCAQSESTGWGHGKAAGCEQVCEASPYRQQGPPFQTVDTPASPAPRRAAPIRKVEP